MTIGWTGAQYSLARVLLGTFVAVQAWSAVDESTAMLVGAALATVLALLLAIGWHDRIAAIALLPLVGYHIWQKTQGMTAWAGPALHDFVGPGVTALLLVAHACQLPRPYGAWSMRGRPDPGGGWRIRPGVFAGLWTVMALGYTAAGVTMLAAPSQAWRMGDALGDMARQEGWRVVTPQLFSAATWTVLALHLAYAPLALVRRLRPWIWTAMVVVNIGLALAFTGQVFRAELLMLHVFTFNPAWIPPLPRRREEGPAWVTQQQHPETIFYDGYCGLCHRWVRFALAEDPAGRAFQFAPLQSPAFERAVPADRRAELPDSVIVMTEDRQLLSRSDAVAHIMRRLGGIWRLLGALLAMLPRFIRDGGYNAVARIRHRLFKKPSDACPMLPPDLRTRFVFESVEAGR